MIYALTEITPTPYRHTQIGWLMIYIFSGMALFGLGMLVIMYGRVAIPVAFAGPVLMLGLSAVFLPLFYCLTTIVDDRTLEVRFGIGLIRRRFPLQDIASVEPVHNSWYHGWGIHWVGSGWVYNVSGWEAVEIRMRNGRRHRIGTDDPEGLAQAISKGIS